MTRTRHDRDGSIGEVPARGPGHLGIAGTADQRPELHRRRKNEAYCFPNTSRCAGWCNRRPQPSAIARSRDDPERTGCSNSRHAASSYRKCASPQRSWLRPAHWHAPAADQVSLRKSAATCRCRQKPRPARQHPCSPPRRTSTPRSEAFAGSRTTATISDAGTRCFRPATTLRPKWPLAPVMAYMG